MLVSDTMVVAKHANVSLLSLAGPILPCWFWKTAFCYSQSALDAAFPCHSHITTIKSQGASAGSLEMAGDTCITYPCNQRHLWYSSFVSRTRPLWSLCEYWLYFGGCESRQCKNIIIQRPDSCRANLKRLPVNATTPLTAGFKALPWQ